MEMRPIGVIRSPFTKTEAMPIQPSGAAGIKGTVEVLPEYAAGLQDLEGFSHVILLYLFDRSVGYELKVVPFMDTTPRGISGRTIGSCRFSCHNGRSFVRRRERNDSK